jgi:hypothetical protein
MPGLTLIKDTKTHVGLTQQPGTARRTIPDTWKSFSFLHQCNHILTLAPDFSRFLCSPQLDTLSPTEEKRFWSVFDSAIAADDGQAAQSHLDAGRPIYYWEDRLQGNVRQWPDGNIELVEIDATGNIVAVKVA